MALILNAIDPRIGGVLIRGEKGTAKSTAVRSLAALLPEIEVMERCPYSCAPNHPAGMCQKCREERAGSFRTYRRKVKVVDLPLNATEDVVLGGIDFEFALKSGYNRFHPGLLAKANRGLLYIDEVNLLDDHIVDVILDASCSGENIVEREGISFRHPARFVLIGSMNPEEGDLRPQLLDRFGLCVQVSGELNPETRVELMKRREEFDNNPEAFIERFQEENGRINDKIVNSRQIISSVEVPKELRSFATKLCLQNNVAGHRADIVIERTAVSLAAYEGRLEVKVDDIYKAAELALSHRRRETMPQPSPPPPEKPGKDTQARDDQNPEEQLNQDQDDREESQAFDQENQAIGKMPETHPGELGEGEYDQAGNADDACTKIFETGATFKVKRIAPQKDRVLRRGSGRRSRTRTAQKQGRYVKSTLPKGRKDIALDATLRAAAPYQIQRRGESSKRDNLRVIIKEGDLREKVREKRVGNFILFLVDASGSMGARARMVASKGAILSLLLDAYQKRDRIAMVSFSHSKATVNLPPTSSVELAANLLKELPVGGRTPLSAGLIKAFDLLRIHLLKEPSSSPIFIIITDGRANAALGEGKPIDEAFDFALKMSNEKRVKYVMVDTELSDIMTFGLAAKLSSALGADYFKIDDLKANELVDIARRAI